MYTSQSPSLIIESTILVSPYLTPHLRFLTRYGALLMFSIPPATTSSLSPALIDCAASITPLSPDPQTLLTVNAPTLTGIPAKMADCRAGFCPNPAETTLPIITSSTCFDWTLALFTDSPIAMAPSLGAGIPTRLLPNFPMAVLHAERMTASGMRKVSSSGY